MWHPEPGWQRLTAGTGSSTVGVWRAGRPGGQAARRPPARRPGDAVEPTTRRLLAACRRLRVERTRRGHPGPALAGGARGRGGRRRHHGVAAAGARAAADRALRRPLPGRVRRGGAGQPDVAGARPAARPDADGRAPRRLADAGADHGRRRRRPPLAAPGDPSGRRRRAAGGATARRPDALEPARHDERGVLALDWATLGTGPVGSDVGYWSLSAREGFEPLVDAYVAGLPGGLASPSRCCSAPG